MNNVKIEYRGNIVKISGNKLSIRETKLSLEKLFDEAKKGIEIDEEKIIQNIKLQTGLFRKNWSRYKKQQQR